MILNRIPGLTWTAMCHHGEEAERQVFVDAGNEAQAMERIKKGYALVHGIPETEVALYNLVSMEEEPARFDYPNAARPLFLFRNPASSVRVWVEDAGARMSALRNAVSLWKLGHFKAAKTLVKHYRLTMDDLPTGFCSDDRQVFQKIVGNVRGTHESSWG